MGGWIGGMGWGGEEAFMTCWRGKQSGTRKKSMAKKWCYQPGQFSVNHQSRLAAVQANEETITLKWAEKPSTSEISLARFLRMMFVLHCHSLRRFFLLMVLRDPKHGWNQRTCRYEKARKESARYIVGSLIVGFSFLGHCRTNWSRIHMTFWHVANIIY